MGNFCRKKRELQRKRENLQEKGIKTAENWKNCRKRENSKKMGKLQRKRVKLQKMDKKNARMGNSRKRGTGRKKTAGEKTPPNLIEGKIIENF